jgi:N-acetyl-alpha-D-muramate 1-phosphate uridylyltransferase
MHPSTLTLPKSMLSVAGRPFVDWQLERLRAAGVNEVVMCIAFLGEQIRDHVGDGARFGLHVTWSSEGPTLLGTAGALRAALPLLSPSFLVTYGDSYLPFDYSGPLHMLETCDDADGVMSIFKNDGKWDSSNVATDGVWVSRYEKGVRDPSVDHIDYGATALRREVVAALPEGVPSGLDRVQTELAKRGRLRAYLAHERFYEVGSPEGLAELDRYLRTPASL